MSKTQMLLIFVVVAILITAANVAVFLHLREPRDEVAAQLRVVAPNNVEGDDAVETAVPPAKPHKKAHRKKNDHAKATEATKRPKKHRQEDDDEKDEKDNKQDKENTNGEEKHHHHKKHNQHEAKPQAQEEAKPTTRHHHHKHVGKEKETEIGAADHHGKAESSGADAATDVPVPPPAKKQTRRRIGKKAFQLVSGDVDNTTFETALSNYASFMSEKLDDEIEQSSRKFTDIVEHSNRGVVLPIAQYVKSKGDDKGDDNADAENPPAAAAGCDPSDNSFSLEKDEQCFEYLSNPRNWASVRAMSSILSSGRTIKFRLFFCHPNISAVLKVSQKKFALEPASEVVALHFDRTLGFNHVPPVVWVPFPIDFLKAASGVISAFYAQWFEKFALKYESSKPLIHDCPEPFEGDTKCLNVSLQLWMLDVHETENTILNPPSQFEKYLTVSTKKEGGHGGAVDWSAPNTLMRSIMKELVDQFLYDYIIGNTDRWFGHNSFTYGGCAEDGSSICKPAPPKERIQGNVSVAFIDQGSAFYKRGPPAENPYSKEGGKDLCRFTKRTAEAITKAVDTSNDRAVHTFYNAFRKKLPGGIYNLASEPLVKAAVGRLNTLAEMIEACAKKHGREEVFFF